MNQTTSEFDAAVAQFLSDNDLVVVEIDDVVPTATLAFEKDDGGVMPAQIGWFQQVDVQRGTGEFHYFTLSDQDGDLYFDCESFESDVKGDFWGVRKENGGPIQVRNWE